jgi:hypothetical protein
MDSWSGSLVQAVSPQIVASCGCFDGNIDLNSLAGTLKSASQVACVFSPNAQTGAVGGLEIQRLRLFIAG